MRDLSLATVLGRGRYVPKWGDSPVRAIWRGTIRKAIQTLLKHPFLIDCLVQMHAFVVYIPLTLTSEGSSTVGCHCWKILFALCISWEGPALWSCKPGPGRSTLPTCAALGPDHVAIQHSSGRLRPDLDLGVPAWVHKELVIYEHGRTSGSLRLRSRMPAGIPA